MENLLGFWVSGSTGSSGGVGGGGGSGGTDKDKFNRSGHVSVRKR